MNNWGDEEEFSDEPNLNNGTRAEGSMHEKSDKGKSRDLTEIKGQLEHVTAMLKQFQQENEKVKNELKEIKVKMTAQKNIKSSAKGPVNQNQNNKRPKPDSSSSENEKNDVIITLESRVEQQDNLLANMFDMITSITKSIGGNQNLSTIGTTNKGGIGSSSNDTVPSNH